MADTKYPKSKLHTHCGMPDDFHTPRGPFPRQRTSIWIPAYLCVFSVPTTRGRAVELWRHLDGHICHRNRARSVSHGPVVGLEWSAGVLTVMCAWGRSPMSWVFFIQLKFKIFYRDFAFQDKTIGSLSKLNEKCSFDLENWNSSLILSFGFHISLSSLSADKRPHRLRVKFH